MTAEVCGRKVFSPRLAAVPLLSCHTSSTTSSSSSSMYSVNLALGALCAAAAATSAADSTALAPPPKLPTHSLCSTLCPGCTTPDCKCDSCWPGQNITHTPHKECACFAKLGFCPPGEDPKYTPGHECPSCWPPENKACMCFASIGFCTPPYRLPTTSRCKTLCPKCDSPKCKCDACWPGDNITHTPDHTCECFAKLGFCNTTAGEKPVYTAGEVCPSCWPPENKACDCFAAVGFCKK
jgi:hypothetical protein